MLRAIVHFIFGIQSHIFRLRSAPSFIFRLALKAIVRFIFGIQSHVFILAFRAIVCFLFGVRSHRSFPIWHSEPRFHFGVQSHAFSLVFKAIFPYSYRHLMPPSLFSLAFKAIVHIRSGTLSPYLSRVLTFRVTSPQLYHSKSWSPTFIFTGIARLTFMGLHLSSFSSLFAQCLPPIRHRSSRFPSSLLMAMSFEFAIRISVMLLSTLHLSLSYSSLRIVSFWHILSRTSEWFDRYSSLV